MKKLTYLIIVALILGLVLTGCSLLSNISQVPATGQSGTTYLMKGLSFDPVLLDSVNIGDTDSELKHDLEGWSDIWSGCGWCGLDANMRLIWGDGGETCDSENNWASVVLDVGCKTAKTLKVEHLDGAADDGFDVYINGTHVGTYVDQYPTNTWTTTEFNISSGHFTGLLTIKFEATAPAWGGCGTYGQVAFNMIELWGGAISATINIDPDELNLNARGKWITAYIELPSGYDVNDIDVSCVKLCDGSNCVTAISKPTKIGDHDVNGVDDLMVKFDRANVATWFTQGDTKLLTLTGITVGGICFEGSDTITTITED